jgi:sugar lactone lactonase YvrE
MLLSGLIFGESPRPGPDGRLWVSDWGAHEIVAVDQDGGSEVMVRLDFPSFQPICIDWLPDRRLLVVAASDGSLLCREPDGSLATYADLNGVDEPPWNDIVVDGRGNAYVNNPGFDLSGGEEFAPGTIALVNGDGSAGKAADGLAFPNGMAVTPDNATLIVAESYANRLTAFDIAADGGLSGKRAWADLGDGVPDGICIDAEGAVWYGDVPNKRCVRVREGSEVLEAIELDVGCFACMLGGADRRTLFMVVREWHGPSTMADESRSGEVLTAEAPAAGAGWP